MCYSSAQKLAIAPIPHASTGVFSFAQNNTSTTAAKKPCTPLFMLCVGAPCVTGRRVSLTQHLSLYFSFSACAVPKKSGYSFPKVAILEVKTSLNALRSREASNSFGKVRRTLPSVPATASYCCGVGGISLTYLCAEETQQFR